MEYQDLSSGRRSDATANLFQTGFPTISKDEERSMAAV
jgi:hypothetical protein